MFDLLGVGVCIACISYLCCVYTTTFMTFSFDSRDNITKRSDCRRVRRKPSSTTLKEKTNFTNNSCNPANGCSYATSQRNCPCATGRCTEPQSVFAAPNGKRKICLIAASFLDFDSVTEDENDGWKCKRLDEGLCHRPSDDNFISNDISRRKDSKQN